MPQCKNTKPCTKPCKKETTSPPKPAKGKRPIYRSKWHKTKIDTRIYRNGEHLCSSYAAHVPGAQYVVGRTDAVSTTFAKRRLMTYTPYEFVGHDGRCC